MAPNGLLLTDGRLVVVVLVEGMLEDNSVVVAIGVTVLVVIIPLLSGVSDSAVVSGAEVLVGNNNFFCPLNKNGILSKNIFANMFLTESIASMPFENTYFLKGVQY